MDGKNILPDWQEIELVSRVDLIGRRFGRGVVEAFSHYDNKAQISMWTVRCDCGTKFTARRGNLLSGNTKSCGCVHGIRISTPILHSELLQLVKYDPASGIFYRIAPGYNCSIGESLGVLDKSNGYVRVSVERQKFWAHRLAWFYMTSAWPKQQIDHEDRNRANNRWANLRIATQTQNNGNFPRRIDNTTGFKGVSRSGRNGKPYRAYIRCRGISRCLGYFDSVEDAAVAYDNAAKEAFGEFARVNFGVSSG